jgi:terminal uridylyltransferase
VAIRDEFRRAWRILGAIGKGMEPQGGIFDDVVEETPPPKEEVKKMGMEDVGVKGEDDGVAGVQGASEVVGV